MKLLGIVSYRRRKVWIGEFALPCFFFSGFSRKVECSRRRMHFFNKIRSSFTSPVYRCLTWRHMQLFVGGLSYDTNKSVLKDAFKDYGEIVEVKVICDRVSGKSRGYGFVRYSSESAATKALKEMDGQLLDGRNIRIHNACDHKGGSNEVKDE